MDAWRELFSLDVMCVRTDVMCVRTVPCPAEVALSLSLLRPHHVDTEAERSFGVLSPPALRGV